MLPLVALASAPAARSLPGTLGWVHQASGWARIRQTGCLHFWHRGRCSGLAAASNSGLLGVTGGNTVVRAYCEQTTFACDERDVDATVPRSRKSFREFENCDVHAASQINEASRNQTAGRHSSLVACP